MRLVPCVKSVGVMAVIFGWPDGNARSAGRGATGRGQVSVLGLGPAMVIPSASLLKFVSFGLQDHSLVSSGPLLLNRRASDSDKAGFVI